jgi:hypothetical protein
MIATPLRRGLRAIYGSEAAIARRVLCDLADEFRIRRIMLPWNSARYSLAWVLAWAWTLIWRSWRMWQWYRTKHFNLKYGWGLSNYWGRRESPEPVRCIDCGWAGPRRWAYHSDLYDECPKCRKEI